MEKTLVILEVLLCNSDVGRDQPMWELRRPFDQVESAAELEAAQAGDGKDLEDCICSGVSVRGVRSMTQRLPGRGFRRSGCWDRR